MGYVLVQTGRDSASIAWELRSIPGVVLAEDLRGPYDAIALARSDSSDPPLHVILAAIQNLAGVTRALVAPLTHMPTGAEETEAA